jgi:acyl-CoA thioester hydrolase
MSPGRPEHAEGRPLGPPRSVSRVRVRYAETDKMGVVYYANYFVWFEVGRTDLLRDAGWSYREMEAEGFSLPVIEAHCDYRQPARYDDDLEVRTTGSLLSPVRVQFTYDIVRPGDDATIATGHTVHATLDRDGRPRRLPERVHALLETPGAAPAVTPARKRTSAPRRETSSSGVPRAVQE